MENCDFKKIREEILKWCQKYLDNGCDFIEIVKNEEQVLMIDFSFPHCLARIDVCHQTFAPYKNVCFEALDINFSGEDSNIYNRLIYFFYDSEEMTIDEIIRELDYGFNYCLYYIPNQLKRKYIQKRGKIQIDGKKTYQVIHPDDIKKIDFNLLKEVFVCIDVQFQYLVVEKNTYSIRILPQIFKTI